MGIKRLLKTGAYYFGISSYSDSINSNGIRRGKQAIALGNHNRTLYSFFVDVSGERRNIFINSGVRLTAGTYSNFSSHFLLGYWCKKRIKISNSIYRSFRITTYTELYYNDPAPLSTPG